MKKLWILGFLLLSLSVSVFGSVSYVQAESYGNCTLTNNTNDENRFVLRITCTDLPYTDPEEPPKGLNFTLVSGGFNGFAETFFNVSAGHDPAGSNYTFAFFTNYNVPESGIHLVYNACESANPENCDEVTFDQDYVVPPPPDTDGDGYTDPDEIAAGTDPQNQCSYPNADLTDTDGDGMTDCDETQYGYNPNDPNSPYPQEYKNWPLGKQLGAVVSLVLGFYIIKIIHSRYVPKGRR